MAGIFNRPLMGAGRSADRVLALLVGGFFGFGVWKTDRRRLVLLS